MDKKNENKQSERELEENLEELKKELTGDKNISEEDKEAVHLQKKVMDAEEKYKRALADYQNLQRRTQEQKAEWIRAANKDLLLKLLPVLDTLMLAAKHISDKGLQITVDQFLKILEQEGLERIKTVGQDYNPHTMEAVTTKDGEDGKVLEEIRTGFILNEFVLRSAQVIVGKENN